MADGGRRAQRWHDEPQSDGDRDNGSNSGSLSGSDSDNYGGSLSGSDKGSRLRRTTPEAPLRCSPKRTSEINTTVRCCTYNSFVHHKRTGASVATALAHQHQHVFLSEEKEAAPPPRRPTDAAATVAPVTFPLSQHNETASTHVVEKSPQGQSLGTGIGRTQSRNALIDVGTISSEASRNLDDELLKQSIQNHGKNHMVGHNTTKYDNVCREFGRKDRTTFSANDTRRR